MVEVARRRLEPQHAQVLGDGLVRGCGGWRRRRVELEQSISSDYLDRMDIGLGHWIEGGLQGHLSWGLMRFRKAS